MTFSFRKTCAQIQEVCQSHSNVIAMISGGVDSMFLGDILHSSGVKPIIAHFQHRIRDNDYREAELVRMFAEERDLKFVYNRGHNLKHAKNQEAEAREQRWGFIENEIANSRGSTVVVTAHHFSDNLENFFMAAVRGRHLSSLVMKKITPYKDYVRYKPLLDITKEEIYKQAKRRRIPWIEDPTNEYDDLTHERNYWRNKIIPDILKIRNINKSMKGLMEELSELDQSNQ